jgi:hypothetical protein
MKPSQASFVLSLILAVAVPTGAKAAPYPGGLGVEAPGDAFVDIVRGAYRWEMPDGHGGWASITHDHVDEHGWPRTDCRWIADWRPFAEWAGKIDDPAAYRLDRSGTYKGSFHGKATLSAGLGAFSITNQTYNSVANITTFDLTIPKPGPNVGLIVLQFDDTCRSPGEAAHSGVSEFKLNRPGYPGGTVQLFSNEYLACLESAAFSTIRFMNVTEANGNVAWGKNHTKYLAWRARKLPDDASVGPMEALGKNDGWPWEYVAELCNEANMDLWLNIPMAADDDYIRQLAMLLKSKLKPGLNIYIEHSNEVWNFSFIQYAWNKARAKEEVSEGNVEYNYDKVNNEEIWAQRRHAQKVHDAVVIFGDVFGKEQINKRIRGMLAGCTPDPDGFFGVGRLPGMLNYLKAITGDPKDTIYAISLAVYYGGKAATGDGGTEGYTVDRILSDMRGDIESRTKDRRAMVALAKQFGLRGGFCAYESGPDIGGGREANIANRILAIRDPRQADLYKENFASGFWDLGGNLAMQFTLAGPYSRFGAWGLTDDIAIPDRNSLFGAVRQLIGAGKAQAGAMTAK